MAKYLEFSRTATAMKIDPCCSIFIVRAAFVSSLSLWAQQATYKLKPMPKTVAWGYNDAKATPVLRVKSGDKVQIDTLIANSPKRLEETGVPDNTELLEGVGPAQGGEASEIPVGRVQDAAVFERERRQIGVADQWTACLAILHHLPMQAPVLLSSRQEAHVGLREPLIHDVGGFLRREPLSGESGVRDDAEEGRYSLPW